VGGWPDGWMDRETDGPADMDDGLDRSDQIENKLVRNVDLMQMRATCVALFHSRLCCGAFIGSVHICIPSCH
jgi:hypothetical protein